jgi:hypothetical protein
MYVWQHASHTLHPVMIAPHAAVLLRWPQLCGVTHLQLAMQSSADCEPCGSRTHWPAVALQLYVVGVGAGVGGTGVGADGLQVAMHSPGVSEPLGSFSHLPLAGSLLKFGGIHQWFSV